MKEKEKPYLFALATFGPFLLINLIQTEGAEVDYLWWEDLISHTVAIAIGIVWAKFWWDQIIKK